MNQEFHMAPISERIKLLIGAEIFTLLPEKEFFNKISTFLTYKQIFLTSGLEPEPVIRPNYQVFFRGWPEIGRSLSFPAGHAVAGMSQPAPFTIKQCPASVRLTESPL